MPVDREKERYQRCRYVITDKIPVTEDKVKVVFYCGISAIPLDRKKHCPVGCPKRIEEIPMFESEKKRIKKPKGPKGKVIIE